MDTYRELTLTVDPVLSLFRTVREFDFPRADVFRAHVEPALVAKWLGPRRLSVNLGHWDCRTGGAYRFSNLDEEGNEYRFFGSFHEVLADERIVQTFTYVGEPDVTALETTEFAELPGGRTRLNATFLVGTVAARDAFLASGMEGGMREGYEQIDDLLAGAVRVG